MSSTQTKVTATQPLPAESTQSDSRDCAETTVPCTVRSVRQAGNRLTHGVCEQVHPTYHSRAKEPNEALT